MEQPVSFMSRTIFPKLAKVIVVPLQVQVTPGGLSRGPRSIRAHIAIIGPNPAEPEAATAGAGEPARKNANAVAMIPPASRRGRFISVFLS